MRKQKSVTPNDPNVKPAKICKFATPTTSSQTQASSQSINCTQIIKPIIGDSLDKYVQIWDSAKKNEIPLPQDNQSPVKLQTQLTQKKNQLAEANIELKKLHTSLSNGKKEHEKICRYIEEECKTRDVIIEGQNLANNLSSLIKENMIEIIDTQEQCAESRQHLNQLYNKVALKQQEIIKDLTKQYNDKELTVLKKKKDSEEQLESKCNKLSILEIEWRQFDEEIKQKTKLINEIQTKVEENEVIIDKNKKEQIEESVRMSETIEKKESKLKAAQETKYKLEAEYNESSAKYNALLSEYKSQQITDSEHQSQIKDLSSSVMKLKEQETSLNNQLDELKDIHLALVSNKDLESAEDRKKQQDLTLMYREAADKKEEAVFNKEKLLKIVAKTFKENEELENSLKTKDDEMIKIRSSLDNVLDSNKEVTEKLEGLNQELIAVEKEICENRVDFETHEAKRGENAKREAEMNAELATIEQQLSNQCAEFEKLLEEADNEKSEFAEQEKEFKEEIKAKDKVIARKEEANENLQLEIERKQSEYNKKIQDATHSSKQCQSLGHEKQLKEQNIEIDVLDRELWREKLKTKQKNEKKSATEARDKQQYDTRVKELKSSSEDLKKKLSTIEKENESLRRKLEEAEASIKAKNTEQKTILSSSVPKPILKSVLTKSPLKFQKVKFDLTPSPNVTQRNVYEMFNEAERRIEASVTSANRPDWKKIQIPNTSDEPDTTTLVTKPQASQSRKFFKHPRSQLKKTSRFGKK